MNVQRVLRLVGEQQKQETLYIYIMEPSERDIFDRSQPADETTAEEERHWLFACIVLVRVLRKCNALQSYTKDKHVTDTKVLLDQTMEGLSIPKSADVSKKQ